MNPTASRTHETRRCSDGENYSPYSTQPHHYHNQAPPPQHTYDPYQNQYQNPQQPGPPPQYYHNPFPPQYHNHPAAPL